ncbi:MAG TPA: HemK/PrmC family methyltransferase [Actinomycetota bacterium]|jgi:release factor glutamine methyltransferase|nr:HemK/PrmC family methyltransferase [Actinomycetota bacterium]
MLRADALTLSGWLHDAEEVLRTAGCPSPRFDAERLAAHGLGLAWGDLWTRLRDELDPARLDGLLDRRRSGEPFGYIVGSVVFCGIEIECGPGVLVPRPETETLVDVALELIAERESPVVVDIGTGTGAVAIAIARARPDAEVWAADLSQDAVRYAERNVRGTNTRVRVVQGDLYDALPTELERRCDLVVSNPPYVPLGAEVGFDVGAEPHEAVYAGPVGDEMLKRLADGAARWVSRGGHIAYEIGSPSQGRYDLPEDFGPWTTRFDHTGRPRVVWARR